MKKDELVHLHMLLAQFKKYCEESGLKGDFSKYDELGISPFQVHRSKDEHKQAIFVLVTELASMAVRDNLTEPRKPKLLT
ncbi:metal-binding protein [ANME-1 cluster archaeon GoMg4]|nr:metal-binding protein [ANME-1 cluster archaeon GoMg4]